MEQKPNPDSQPVSEPKPETATPPTSGSPLSIRNLLPGMVLGILLGVAGFLAYQKHLPQITQTFYVVTLTSFGVLILTFILLYAFKKQISTLIFGSQAANAGEIIEDAQKVSDVLTDRFAEQLLKDVPADVRQRVRFILPRLANWFVWSRFRNWWWQWVLGIFVSLGGLTGTLLLMNQNELLNNQNSLIQHQMLLDEASRRSSLVVLMSNILDKVDKEIEVQQEGLSLQKRNTTRFSLSQSLIGQIVALSHSFKPYRYMSGDTLIAKRSSPERGQLLMTLVLLPLDTNTLHKIYESATFEEADLNYGKLNGADLKGADLLGADLSNAGLINADLREANLAYADLSNTNLSKANLSKANFEGADLSGSILIETVAREGIFSLADFQKAQIEESNFVECQMNGANFEGASIVNSSLIRANLTGATFLHASLQGTDLSDVETWILTSFYDADLSNVCFKNVNLDLVDLRSVYLEGADLTDAGLNIKQLTQVLSLYNCEGIPDSIKSVLLKTHPHLFLESNE